MSQQQAQSKARSSAPPAEVPSHRTTTTSTSTTASTSTSNGPFPPFLTSRPSTSPQHLPPLPPLPPLPNIHPTARLYHEGKLPEEGGGGGGLRPPFFGLGEAQGTAEGSRETSADQDGGEEGGGESEVGTPGPAGRRARGREKPRHPLNPGEEGGRPRRGVRRLRWRKVRRG
ncbi:hypothetical protein BCR35DRAFT_120191 [Leucosporidium creatinivorum]|uniref:Uncharacterized protein n=1 Tax=Leucosporidium creatinivorum TaxID=106004 RepID=A0A1Y2EY27_9BASI|nr:hypothetical protein BCR35DRAFT_120191 [Leucosporidium creatinivorum]